MKLFAKLSLLLRARSNFLAQRTNGSRRGRGRFLGKDLADASLLLRGEGSGGGLLALVGVEGGMESPHALKHGEGWIVGEAHAAAPCVVPQCG
jgi:hypothetical protein